MHIATKSSKIITSSKKQLEELANKICAKVKQGNTLFLFGEMGVGKTLFVKYFINCLQQKYNQELTEVTSPTFNIMNEYIVKDLLIKHYDFYRVKSPNELKNLNLFDKKEKAISLVEWPEIIKKKPNDLIELYFKYENEYKDRFIEINN
tara:strand:- start:17 stop:463 length:447 start_codon:yes stop_codon:yes gene_type:complete